MFRTDSGRFVAVEETDGGTLPGQVQNGEAIGSVTAAWRETPHSTQARSDSKDAKQPPQAANVRSSEDNAQSSNIRSIMPNADDMKNQMREQMCKPKYDVAMYYHKTGFTQWIARHPRFEHLTLIVIALNALWIWIDTDHNPGAMLLSSPPFFQIVEQAFCIYFTFEWAMRFGAFKQKRKGLRDNWFVFDSFLVGTMVFETWLMTAIVVFATDGGSGGLGNASILRMARLLRLTRMARMARLLRAMPELLILIKGMLAAMRSVCFTMGLLFIMLYIFGIAFVQLCDDSPCQSLFPDVPNAMHELLLNAALMESLAHLVLPLKEQSIILMLVLYAFIFLSALTVMNMLIGVICEVVSAVAATERETLSLAFVREKMEELLNNCEADQDNDNLISKEEFEQMLMNPKAMRILQDVDVDVVGLVDFKDTIFEPDAKEDDDETAPEEKKLTVPEMMGLILDLRGSNTATVRDLVNLKKYLNGKFAAIDHKLARFSRHSGPLHAPHLSPRPSSAPHGACDGGQDDHDAESTSDSVKRCPSARAGSSPRFLDMFHSLRGLMSAHQVEIAAVEAENRQLKEQVAQLASDACRSSLSKAQAFCTELDVVTPNTALLISPCNQNNLIQPPREPAADIHPSAALRTAAAGAVDNSFGQGGDVGAGNTAFGVESALGGESAFRTSATFTSQTVLKSQQPAPRSPKESCTASREIVAASLVARTVASNGAAGPC